MQLHNQLLVGIFTMEFVNLGYFITLLFAPGYIIMAVLVVITLGYVSFVGKKYVRPMKLLAIHAAADLDRADTVRPLAPDSIARLLLNWLQDCF